MIGLNLTGKRFGRLVVLKDTGKREKSQKVWMCKCDCGNTKEVITSYLTSGDTKSCGCYRKECELKNLGEFWGKPKTHGLSKTRVYRIWIDMNARCEKKNNKAYKHYGERGIKVCKEWKENFLSFYNWAIKNGYKDELSIDRINVNGNYEPNNCRWADAKTQGNNKRNTRKIKIFNEVKTAYDFEKQYGIKAYLLLDRYDKGYRDDKLIYKSNLSHFRKCKNKRDSKGRFIKNEKTNKISASKGAVCKM